MASSSIADQLLLYYNVETYDIDGDVTTAPALGGTASLVLDELLRFIGIKSDETVTAIRLPQGVRTALVSSLAFSKNFVEGVELEDFTPTVNTVQLFGLDSDAMNGSLKFLSRHQPERLVCLLNLATCDLSQVTAFPPFRLLALEMLPDGSKTEKKEKPTVDYGKIIKMVHESTALHLMSPESFPDELYATLANLIAKGQPIELSSTDPKMNVVLSAFHKLQKEAKSNKKRERENSSDVINFCFTAPTSQVLVPSSLAAWKKASGFVRELIESSPSSDMPHKITIPKPTTEFPPAAMKAICEFVEALDAEPLEVLTSLEDLERAKKVLKKVSQHPYFLPWSVASTEIGAMCTATDTEILGESADQLKKLLRLARCADFLNCKALLHVLLIAVVVRVKLGVFQRRLLTPPSGPLTAYPRHGLFGNSYKQLKMSPHQVQFDKIAIKPNQYVRTTKGLVSMKYLGITSVNEIPSKTAIQITVGSVGMMIGICPKLTESQKSLFDCYDSDRKMEDPGTICVGRTPPVWYYEGNFSTLGFIRMDPKDVISLELYESTLILENETTGETDSYPIEPGQKYQLLVSELK